MVTNLLILHMLQYFLKLFLLNVLNLPLLFSLEDLSLFFEKIPIHSNQLFFFMVSAFTDVFKKHMCNKTITRIYIILSFASFMFFKI